MKPASYPFMQIAKKHGYDYAETLQVASCLRESMMLPLRLGHWIVRTVACLEIIAANEEFRAIQRGEIDWMTGEKK